MSGMGAILAEHRGFGTILRLVIFALAWPVLGTDAFARNIYVDDDATGRGNGSRSAPYSSITEAAKRVRGGDNVLVAPGVYTEPVVIRRGGSRSNPVVFQPLEQGTVVIDGSRTRADTDLVKIFADNVVFQGFTVKNATRSGISVWGSRNVTIRGNTVSGSRRSGIWAGHTRPGNSSWIRIEGNTVFGNVRENSARNWSSGWARGIAVDLTEHAVVRLNRVYHNYGEGIGVLSTEDARIYNNIVYDNYSVNIYLDNAPKTSVRGNVVFTKRNFSFYRNRRPAIGIAIANEHTNWPKASRNIRVSENRLVGVGDVIYGTWGANTGIENSVLGPNQIN